MEVVGVDFSNCHLSFVITDTPGKWVGRKNAFPWLLNVDRMACAKSYRSCRRGGISIHSPLSANLWYIASNYF